MTSKETRNSGNHGEMLEGLKRPWLNLTYNEADGSFPRDLLADFLDTPLSLETVKPHLSLMVKPRNNDTSVIKRPLLNLDLVVCFKVKKGFQAGVFGVLPELAHCFNESEDTFFQLAYENTKETFKICSMSSALMGFSDTDESDISPAEDDLMYVCTTKDKLNGAVALNYPEVFKSFCEEKHLPGIYIIPSSIHELILLPTFAFNPEELAQMVLSVNETVLEPDIRLDPVVYEYRPRTNQVTIAAMAKESPSTIARQFIAF
ncbi:hypothetical protein IKF28_03115 [Candidatus Saccharibacteria bacterium]|nr:hypothetical protein [Candidatus Saccharibacteria bacterium]